MGRTASGQAWGRVVRNVVGGRATSPSSEERHGTGQIGEGDRASDEGESVVVKPAAEKVQAVIKELGLDRLVIELDAHARTSEQAAQAIGVGVGQIAKSLVFMAEGSPILVVASGANRVDERRLAALLGRAIRRADPEAVKRATGFSIGGVAPLGHPVPLPVYIDRDLLQHALIYAAAGGAEYVFPLTPDELVRATGGAVVDIKQQTIE